MDWPRLAGVTFDALIIAFTLVGVLTPPDPFTQLLYAAPAFAVALLAMHLYGQRSSGPWWKRYLVFVAGLLPVWLSWWVFSVAVSPGAAVASEARPVFLLGGVALGAWLAYFGGVERFRQAASEA